MNFLALGVVCLFGCFGVNWVDAGCGRREVEVPGICNGENHQCSGYAHGILLNGICKRGNIFIRSMERLGLARRQYKCCATQPVAAHIPLQPLVRHNTQDDWERRLGIHGVESRHRSSDERSLPRYQEPRTQNQRRRGIGSGVTIADSLGEVPLPTYSSADTFSTQPSSPSFSQFPQPPTQGRPSRRSGNLPSITIPRSHTSGNTHDSVGLIPSPGWGPRSAVSGQSYVSGQTYASSNLLPDSAGVGHSPRRSHHSRNRSDGSALPSSDLNPSPGWDPHGNGNSPRSSRDGPRAGSSRDPYRGGRR